MTDVALFWDEAVLAHDPPDGTFSLPETDLLAVPEPHPDSPDRVHNIVHILDHVLDVEWEPVQPATETQLQRVHEASYLDELRRAAEEGPTRLNPTTVAAPGTYLASRYAAGAAIGAAEVALESDSTVPYAPVRPSGHHAQPASADGFCFVNNVAVATEHVLSTGPTDRVAILDWDVHHGNGTQAAFEKRDDVLVASIHGDHGPWNEHTHTRTGRPDEPGVGDGEGYSVNIPLPLGTGDAGYEYAFETVLEPVIGEFEPDLLLVSAGQDPDANDPLGRNVVSPGGFRGMGAWARRLAEDYAGGNLGFVQEGGYQRSYLAFDTLAIFLGVLDRHVDLADAPIDPTETTVQWPNQNTELARERVDEVSRAYAEYWDALG